MDCVQKHHSRDKQEILENVMLIPILYQQRTENVLIVLKLKLI
jgi:hypothetical protein